MGRAATSLSAHIRDAARSLARSPLFAAIAVASLGLALALNTTMFALIDAVAHPAVPYAEPHRVVTVSFLGGNRERTFTLEDRFRAVRDGSTTYESLAGYTVFPAMVKSGTLAEQQRVVASTAELFAVLGVRPVAGRIFAQDATGDEAFTAVISFRVWKRSFAGRSLEDGLRLDVGPRSYTVIGVLPRGVHFPNATDVWVPLASIAADTARKAGPFPVIRLKAGVTPEMARRDLTVVANRLSFVDALGRTFVPRVVPLARLTPAIAIPPGFGPTAFMVLVIACANLGTMMLARGMARRRDTAIRVALGAPRHSVVGQVLAECGLLIAGGVAIGALLTGWALYILPHVVVPFVAGFGDLDPRPSWRVFAFVLSVSVAMLVAAGLVPSLRAAATDPSEAMKEAAGSTTGRVRDRYNPLIVIEVALSTALLMTAALFLLIELRLAIHEFRYAGHRLVVASVGVDRRVAPDDAAVQQFYESLIARSKRLSGVREAATLHWEKPDGPMVFTEQGKGGEQWMNLRSYLVVSADFLRTFGISVVDGRDFQPGDAAGSSAVVIVDEDAARRLWPNVRSPVGRMIKLGGPSSSQPWLRVVGVARSVELQPPIGASLPPEPSIYVLQPDDMSRYRELVVQGNGAGGDQGRAALAVALRREIEASAPGIGATYVRPWLQALEYMRTFTVFMASLFSAFSVFGLVLCAAGLYGVLAYAVSRRLREFAVRIALGARSRDIARIVVHDAAVTALAGIGIGAFLALWQTRGLVDALLTMRFVHAVALVIAELVLLLVALAACLGPVRRATRANPVDILRSA